MAIIKAGTYRFNDVLSVPTTYIDGFLRVTQSLRFTCTSIVPGLGAVTLVGSELDVIEDGSAEIGYYGVRGYYTAVSSIPDLSDYGSSFPYTIPVYYGDTNWDTTSYGDNVKTITIPTDQEVSDEFEAWFNVNAVKTSKPISGTWKFNDSVVDSHDSEDLIQDVEFISNNKKYISMLSHTGSENNEVRYYYSDSNYDLAFDYGFHTGSQPIWLGEEYKTITFLGEQEVSEDFYNWFTANAKRLSTITYNGLTIATLNGGQTATLKCKGMKMATDVVVEVAENVGGGGECKHEVYDLSVSNIRSVLLKSKIERPTAEQINLFDNGVGIAYVPFDVEGLEHITDVEYQTVVISEGVSISMVYLRATGQGVMAYYVWEEDIPIMKAIMPSMGLDVSAVTGEGWQFVTEDKVRTLSNEELKELNLYRTYYYLIPCGDYLDSLFTFHISEGEPVDVVTIDDRKVLLTKDTLCQQDIWAKKIGYQGVYVCDEDHMGSIAGFNDEKEYDDLTYIDVTFVANGVDDYLMVGGRGQDLSGVTKPSFSASLSPNETRMVKVRRNSTKGITVETHSEIIRTVYTNATIVSQSDDKVYISGLRHDTHIVVVTE